ncbi:UDP-glucosyltransferase 2-like [Pieris napi]|uniref:UDP-glucosyltransferase 2-like n=1 Tax=Pieris napi TaxID=78633 RepID=UPI001FBB08FF|nr:UDP-glucosyltransferase 2-like [Pieris napi]
MGSFYQFWVIFFLNEAQSARILGLFPHPGKSHQIVFDPVMKALAGRGHEITVMTFFPHLVAPENYKEVNLQSLTQPQLDFITIDSYEKPSWIKKIPIVGNIWDQYIQHIDLANHALEICKKMIQFPPVVDTLKKQYDLVIVENFAGDCMLGLISAFGIKAPVVGLSSPQLLPNKARRMGADDNPAYVPIVTSSFSHKMSFFQRVENTIVHYLSDKVYQTLGENERRLIEESFGRRIPDIQELANNQSLILVNSYHVLNGVYPRVPGIVEVGGIHIQPKNDTIPTLIEKYLNESNHGVILFSFGSSLCSSSLSRKTENELIKSFSKLKQRVIWKHSESSEGGSFIGKNILRVKWIPQAQLLQHPKVLALVGHGGLLGIMEAVTFGKPIVAIPVYADHRSNAAAVETAGIGVILPISDLQANNFVRAIEIVLSQRMRERARHVSAMWHDREQLPLDTAVYWTERVIRWGNQSPLSSQSKYLPFYQYALLDVAAFLTLLFTLLLLTLYYLTKYIINFFKNNYLKVVIKEKSK